MPVAIPPRISESLSVKIEKTKEEMIKGKIRIREQRKLSYKPQGNKSTQVPNFFVKLPF